MMFKTFKEMQSAAAFLGIAFIEGALLYKLIASQNATTELLIAIGFVGILFLLWYRADSLTLFTWDKDGIKVELEQLRNRVSENEQEIADLMLMSMGEEAFINLQKLARDGGFREYVLKPHEGLMTELYHLRNLGYIKKKGGNEKPIFEIPESGKQLSDYIEVTGKGKKYIELRKKRNFPEDAQKLVEKI